MQEIATDSEAVQREGHDTAQQLPRKKALGSAWIPGRPHADKSPALEGRGLESTEG